MRFCLLVPLFISHTTFSRTNSFLETVKNGFLNKVSSKLLRAKGRFLLLNSLFCLILTSKLLGLFPFSFGWTSHIMIIFPIAFRLWVRIKLSKLFSSPIGYFSAFTPQSVPLALGVFLSQIEFVRKFIRPLTLSLRLGIKVTTGHILLSLISVIGVSRKWFFVILILLRGYFVFEIFVMVIQAVVFNLLLSQYLEGEKT